VQNDLSPSERHEEQQRRARLAAFVQTAFEKAIEGGGTFRMPDGLMMDRQVWVAIVEADAIAAFEVIERYRKAAR